MKELKIMPIKIPEEIKEILSQNRKILQINTEIVNILTIYHRPITHFATKEEVKK